MLRIGEQLYLKANAAFWGKSDSAGKLGDKFVKVPQSDPHVQAVPRLHDMHVLLDGLLGLDGKLTKAPYGKVGHGRVVPVLAAGGKGGRLSVCPWRDPIPAPHGTRGRRGAGGTRRMGPELPAVRARAGPDGGLRFPAAHHQGRERRDARPGQELRQGSDPTDG
ncbi:hypothetical protein ACFSNO_32325 [Streptomyces cirratus]